ncbi:hypothetical protein [Enterobacter hormaechei]|uniref:hypothetical protein n=1 Tax=Enterobacter hormaechei TaxID=158836 RepID=UPI00125C2661|nr:hypothetical protein [Enterobacter hormaechei]KAE9724631.1 hypothetical protein GP710_15985 [Escherichia coli]MBU5665563.1 hypothetical protein [Enterobacteriaceae bacterium S32_ASV_15]VAL24639.1 Uncharacterised protein [Enterobacter hormaechei]
MSGRTHAAYANYFQNGRKAHRLAEVERQLAAETSHQQEERQLEAEARSAENITDHFPRVIPDTPLIEWLPGHYIHRSEWEAYRDGLKVIDVTEQRLAVDPQVISFQWNYFVMQYHWPWRLENYAIKYELVCP